MAMRSNIYRIIEPRTKGRYAGLYDAVMLLAIIIGIFPLMFRTQTKLFWWFDLISGLCFIVDYILRWMTADFSSKRGKVAAFIVYPFTPMAIIDLLSILPVFNLLAPSFKIVRVSRFLKIIRVFKFIRYFAPLVIILSVIRKQGKILCTVLSLAIFYIFITYFFNFLNFMTCSKTVKKMNKRN